MTSNQNFSGQTTPSIIDDHYVRCNFSQPQPVDFLGSKRGVRIFPGDDTPRTFEECNLMNCEVPPGSTVTGCLTVMAETDLVIGQDTVTVDGTPIVTDIVATRVHGRWTPGGYEDLPSPVDHENQVI